ncbi:hypothetical protein R1sor_013965 [Riccia sorocarpa]|uniref:RRM domain-containing protein n=1 Tax=Riccia sorocarpa TaxID=122646 RepID=A0ABD3HC77_9MARC
MFDLNELPEGDGFFTVTVGKTEGEGIPAPPAEVSVSKEALNRNTSNPNRDDEAAEAKEGSVSKKQPPALKSSTTAYREEKWEAEKVAEYDASNRVSKSPAARGASTEIGLGLETKLLDKVEAIPDTGFGFGISAGPEKLGLRTSSPKQSSDLTTDFLNRSPEKLDVPTGGYKLGGDAAEDDDGNLQSQPPSLHSSDTGSVRKGKRARDDDSLGVQATADQAGPSSKRPPRSAHPGAIVEVDRETGPSLSMAVDREVAELVTPATNHKARSSKGDLSIHEEAVTSLSLGETSLTGVKADISISRESDIPTISTIRPVLALSISASVGPSASVNKEIGSATTSGIADKKLVSGEVTAGMIAKDANVVLQAPDAVSPNQPFWRGQLRGDGVGLIDVAAYCSEEILSASQLRSLPQVLTVEKISRLSELFDAVRQGPIDDPVFRIKHPPSSTNLKGETFASLFQPPRVRKQGALKAGGGNQMEFHHGLRNGSADRDMGPPGFTHNDDQYVAVVKLKDPKSSSTGRRGSKVLYLVLDTVAEAACDTDVPFRKKFEREIIEYGNIEESIIYAVLCHPPDRDRSAEAGPADELTPEVVTVSRDSSQAAQPDAPSGKVIAEKRSSSTADVSGAEPVDRDRGELLKSRDNKETPDDSSHEVRRSEKNKARKDDAGKERHKEREREKDRGKEKEREGRSVTKDGHRHTHRSSEKVKELDTVKRDRSKDRDADRVNNKERERNRDSQHEPADKSHRVKDPEREKPDKQREKEREKVRDRDKEKDKERPARKRDRSAAELDRVTGDEKNLTPDAERPAPGFGLPAPGFSSPPPGFSRDVSSGLGAATLLGKDIRRRGKIVDEDVAFDEKYGFEFKTSPPERETFSVSKKTGHSTKMNNLDSTGARVSTTDDGLRASRNKETASDVDRVGVKTMDALSGLPDIKSVNVTSTKESTVSSEGIKEKLTPDRPAVAAPSEGILQSASEDARTIQATLKSTACVDPSILGEIGTTSRKGTEETMDIDGEIRVLENVQGGKKSDTLKVQVQATEFRSSITKSDNLSVANVATSSKVVPSGRVSGLDTGRPEVAAPADSSGNDGVTGKSISRTKEVLLPPKGKGLSLRVENIPEPISVRKYDSSSKGGGQELEPSPGPFDKSIHAGAEDVQATRLAVQYSPTAIDNGSVTPVAFVEKDVSLDFVLSACDKETRAWLVSKPNEVYLAEEFGVRILRMEEIPSAKIDLRPRIQHGPVNVRLSLATDKSTDANEARWFINQAADMLRAVASRGVFAKCLWYQGPVQRLGGELGPSIQAVVKKIKGEDGKNLERIQEDTGVMIGIVLDANNKKGIVNSSRVIGLRLKCIRKRGFVEATRQAEELLAQVAELFSKDIGAGSAAGPQDVGLAKLKVDNFSTASPSSGIVTPMPKDLYAAYSPASPLTASSTPLTASSIKSKLDESPIEAKTFSACATAVPSASSYPGSAVKPDPPTSEEINVQSPQNISEDEESDRVLKPSDAKSGSSRPLYVSSLPSFASAPMLKQLFEEVLKKNCDGSSELVLDINLDQGNRCAFVEFASDELLRFIMKAYAEDSKTFCGLKLELGSSAALRQPEKQYRTGKTEASVSAVELGSGPSEVALGVSGARKERTLRKTDDLAGRFAGTTDSDCEVFPPQERRYSGSMRVPGRSVDRPKPLFLTELMRNASAKSVHDLFEEIIKKYGYPALGSFKGKPTIVDVRYIPSRGCAFVDLATSELVDFLLDLHTRKPEVFFDIKMEVGRRPLPGQAEDESPLPSIVKRLTAPNRYPYVPDETIQTYSAAKRPRRHFQSISPPRRDPEHDHAEEHDEEGDEERLQNGVRKQQRRSDPERTVYADRLPENATEGMIRRIFETVLRESLSEEQRERFGEELITEVRHVPTKFCAFIVFGREELTRLVLQLYNQDEDIFENMRLKPHFHSRMEDLYREDLHERDDGGPTFRMPLRDTSLMDRRRLRAMDDYYHSGSDVHDLRRGRVPTAHRAVAATAFKEVDRRRSVYVDRIPEHLPEPKMRDMFERALRQNRHAFNAQLVSQVTFFRDKFDKDKLCAFVELENEELVQELLEVYTEDEESFKGMRVRPAIKYGGH